MKLHNLHDGTPLLCFGTREWADFDMLLQRLVQEFGCRRRDDPHSTDHCWLEREGMRLEAGPDPRGGWRIRALDRRAEDLLRVVVGAVLKEVEDQIAEQLREAARAPL